MVSILLSLYCLTKGRMLNVTIKVMNMKYNTRHYVNNQSNWDITTVWIITHHKIENNFIICTKHDVVTIDHGYVLLVVITILYFLRLLLITVFVTRVTRQVPHVGKELFTLPEYLSSPQVFSGVSVDWSLVFCVIICW
jgi:hypothetical protein